MNIPSLKNILTGGAGELVKNIGDAADKLFTSKEEVAAFKLEAEKEINRATERMAELAVQETEIHLKDTQNARDTNTRIQESPNASWLAKNIAYCLDVFFVLAFVAMLLIIVFKEVPEKNKELFYTAFGLLGGFVSTVINFHRGTSRGSEDKQKHINSMLSK
jgi:hypothetical protein